MSQVIASTYEILEKIGSGGGGVVYLGRHLRLGKLVVLKADKRTLTAKPEALRREVDALKNLSHTYIPQVYDFVAEGGVVYTVMDYIEGESLDKPLKRGERFSQAQVIAWACQLLEALCYLHSRQPHGILHADIKPANIMLTPQGDICLIDFNIALVLGEEGAVRVGYSQGYASPEHYGADFSGGQKDAKTVLMSEFEPMGTCMSTVVMDDPNESAPGQSASGGFSGGSYGGSLGNPSSSSKRTVLLDVRSDIYSLGATLYHLLTGVRPAKKADEVVPVHSFDWISPAVAAIIEKAMQPNLDNRYQNAAEMLYDFEHLHENDPRTIKHKKLTQAVGAALIFVFLLGGMSAFVGLKQIARTQNAYALAEYSAAALRDGDVSAAISYALQALPEKQGLLDLSYTAQAQCALANALGVYDLTDGFKAARTITLDSEPIKAALSDEGTYTAVITQGKLAVFDTESGARVVELAADPSALSDVVFVGEDKVIFAGEGAITAYSLQEQKELWRGEPATAIALSADGTRVAGLYKDETCAYVYEAESGKLLKTVDFHGLKQSVMVNNGFADPDDNLFVMSGNGDWLAVSFEGGALYAYNLQNSADDVEIYESSDYTHFEGGFCGSDLAYAASGSSKAIFSVIDMDKLEDLGAFVGTFPYLAYADADGIYVADKNLLVKLDPETGEQTEMAYTESDITGFAVGAAYTVTATSDGAYAFFDKAGKLLEKYENNDCDFVDIAGKYALTASRDVADVRILALENHAEAQIFSYDIAYPHDEARISADGQTVMLFSYDKFRLYSIGGTMLADEQIANAEDVYDQQYCRDENGSYLKVIYNNGLVRCYSALDGSVISEVQGEKPDSDLSEEFYTDNLKIVSPLHGTPVVYDIKTGKQVGELAENAYLTYVTQVGENIITEYVTTEGERYGLLMNEKCETLAELPGLCDVLPDGNLVFDDNRGNLRQSCIYSIQELLALAKNN